MGNPHQVKESQLFFREFWANRDNRDNRDNMEDLEEVNPHQVKESQLFFREFWANRANRANKANMEDLEEVNPQVNSHVKTANLLVYLAFAMERTTVVIILMKERLAKATLGLLQNRSKVQVDGHFIPLVPLSLEDSNIRDIRAYRAIRAIRANRVNRANRANRVNRVNRANRDNRANRAIRDTNIKNIKDNSIVKLSQVNGAFGNF